MFSLPSRAMMDILSLMHSVKVFWFLFKEESEPEIAYCYFTFSGELVFREVQDQMPCKSLGLPMNKTFNPCDYESDCNS